VESHRQKELFSYLTCNSKATLGHFLLKQHSEAANLKKEFREVGTLLVESLGVLNLVNLLREHGEELLGTSTIPKEAELADSSELQHRNFRWIYRDPEIKAREKLVLGGMMSYRDDKGEVGATVGQIAFATQLSKRGINRALDKLRKAGIVQAVRTVGHGHIRVYVIKPTAIYFEMLQRHEQWREAQIKRLGLQAPTIPAASPTPVPAQPAWAMQRDEREAATRRELNAGSGPSSGARVRTEVLKKKVGA
jgi:DNA-binding transcriptional ArsR family regulator